MGQIRKVGDTYFIEFYARGLMYSKIAGTDLAAAEKLLKETEETIAGGEALTVVRQIELTDFFKQFKDYAAAEFGERSTERFDSLIRHFQVFLARTYPDIHQLSQITPSILEAYKASRQKTTKPHLINFSILLLREILDYGIKIGFINDNPTVHLRLLKLSDKKFSSTKRTLLAKELLSKGIGLGKTSQLLKVSDIARVMYYANLIPLSREELYN
jgi:hypothetical protein